jgi:hypothetical protein
VAGGQRGPVEVTVEIGGEELVAGTMRITERRGQSMTFEYAQNYLADVRAYRLDPVLPLSTGVFQPPAGASVFNAFADAAPDRWGQNYGSSGMRVGVRGDLSRGVLFSKNAQQAPAARR